MLKPNIMDDEILRKPLFACTLGEFVEALSEKFGIMSGVETESTPNKKNLVYGLSGLSDLLGCSPSTAYRIKKSGIINEALHQVGKVIVIDADLVLELLKISKRKIRKF